MNKQEKIFQNKEFRRGSFYGSMLMISYLWIFAAAGLVLAMALFPNLWVIAAAGGWFAFNILIQPLVRRTMLRISSSLVRRQTMQARR